MVHAHSIKVLESDGSFWAEVGGRHYVAATREGVFNAIRHHYPVNDPLPVEATPEPRPHDILRTGSLDEKQVAKTVLVKLAAEGDTEAYDLICQLDKNRDNDYISATDIEKEVGKLVKIPQTPQLPLYRELILREAKKLAGGRDFSDLTYSEITEKVSDVVMRNALIRLLMKRYEVR